MKDISFEINLNLPYNDALEAVSSALMEEGFGILTNIDVKDTLKAKIDKDFRPYTILGACNPPLAYKALNTVPEIGLFLPCNITVEAVSDNKSAVRILDPKFMVSIDEFSKVPMLVEVAEDAHIRLQHVANILNRLAT